MPDVDAYEAVLRRHEHLSAERSAVSRQLMRLCADAERTEREVSLAMLMSRWRETEELDRSVKRR